MKKTTRKHNAPAVVTTEKEVSPVMTSEETAIALRVMAESKGWADIKERDVDDYAAANDPMELPPPAKESQRRKENAFRWFARTKEKMDEMRNKEPFLRWDVCNAMTTPFLKGYFDPLLGCVCKLDCLLGYKPWKIYEMEKRYKRLLAEGKDAAGDIVKKDGAEIQKGAKFIAGSEIKAGDRIIADETVDSRIDNYEETQNFEQDAQAV